MCARCTSLNLYADHEFNAPLSPHESIAARFRHVSPLPARSGAAGTQHGGANKSFEVMNRYCHADDCRDDIVTRVRKQETVMRFLATLSTPLPPAQQDHQGVARTLSKATRT